jgi:hypothetical protein
MFKRRRSADDFAEEINAHLGLEADELKAEGLTEEEARRRARVEFGNVHAAQERFYLKNRVEWLDNLVRDTKFAIRQLVKNPGFAITAILVLALGIGASVAIFGFVDAALLEPLPYANPGRLTSVNESSVESQRWPLSYPDFLEWQRLNKSFSSLDVYSGIGYRHVRQLGRRGRGYRYYEVPAPPGPCGYGIQHAVSGRGRVERTHGRVCRSYYADDGDAAGRYSNVVAFIAEVA